MQVHIPIVEMLMLIGVACAGVSFGTWKMNAARSTFTGDIQPRSLEVRIEPHPKGEVFTLDRVETDGRMTSSSTILYFDSAPRTFQDSACMGTQSSRRVDSRTIEIFRKCTSGEWTWLLRRSAVRPQDMTLDITEHHPDGRTLERRLVLEKQSGAAKQYGQ